MPVNEPWAKTPGEYRPSYQPSITPQIRGSPSISKFRYHSPPLVLPPTTKLRQHPPPPSYEPPIPPTLRDSPSLPKLDIPPQLPTPPENTRKYLSPLYQSPMPHPRRDMPWSGPFNMSIQLPVSPAIFTPGTSNSSCTTSNLPRLDPQHSAPTVAGSGLKASISVTDLSQPTPKARDRLPPLRRVSPTRIPSPTNAAYFVTRNSVLTTAASMNDMSRFSPEVRRPRFSQLRFTPTRMATPTKTPTSARTTTPTRIPTPKSDGKHPASTRRHVSTPILPSQSQKKENIGPKTLRLLGPISPTRQQQPPVIPKSRTMGMLSSLTSTFYRSNLNLNTGHASTISMRTAEATTSVSAATPLPLPMFTTNVRQILTAQLSAYWSGHFQALHDRFHTEMLEATLQDPETLARFVSDAVVSPIVLKAMNKVSSEQNLLSQTVLTKGDLVMMEDENRRCKRVFIHLQALCVTDEAEESLWHWQLLYARLQRNEKLLPSGGRMRVDSGGWMSRVGRAMSSMGTSGSSLGRRSGLNAFGRRRREVT